MARELLIYCDESDISGRHFANFYGGLLVESTHLEEVEQRINDVRAYLHLHDEIKWQKISAGYAGKYIALMDVVFDLLEAGKLKIRIMFTHNRHAPARLTPEQREMGFFLLYYQFVKHAFGLVHAGAPGTPTRLRLMFDALPDKLEKRQRFKAHLVKLADNDGFRNGGLRLDATSIAEVDSKAHPLLQCMDVVLGAMQFRLNDKHKEKPEGSRLRGKRTVAKERVYRHILARIRRIRPTFNPGISTGTGGVPASRWHDPYRHWLFVPDNAVLRPEFSKGAKRKPHLR